MDSAKMKIVWMISQNGDRSFWTKIGVGHVNRDGSINLVLDAIPLGAHKLQLRDYTPRDAEPREGASPAPRAARGEEMSEGRSEGRGQARAEAQIEASP
jgi:hypothetical protein